MTTLAATKAELDALAAAHVKTRPDGLCGVVMTMGALHEGHASLMHATRERIGADGFLIVTDFVNPTQFGPGEDFTRYPRTLDHDLAVCEAAGVDAVFAPSVEEVYGSGTSTAIAGSTVSPDAQVTVDPGSLGTELEGAARPGHFRGVLTVVAKLLHLTRPDVAAFGEKDYQQLVLITRMVEELRFNVEVLPVATMREPDGLAMSSRNRFLDDAARASAKRLSEGLRAAQTALATGSTAADAEDAGRSVIGADPSIDLDYFVVRSTALSPAQPGPVRLLVAARVGGVRLIDNIAAELS